MNVELLSESHLFVFVFLSNGSQLISIYSSSSLFDFSNPYSFIYSKLMALDADS